MAENAEVECNKIVRRYSTNFNYRIGPRQTNRNEDCKCTCASPIAFIGEDKCGSALQSLLIKKPQLKMKRVTNGSQRFELQNRCQENIICNATEKKRSGATLKDGVRKENRERKGQEVPADSNVDTGSWPNVKKVVAKTYASVQDEDKSNSNSGKEIAETIADSKRERCKHNFQKVWKQEFHGIQDNFQCQDIMDKCYENVVFETQNNNKAEIAYLRDKQMAGRNVELSPHTLKDIVVKQNAERDDETVDDTQKDGLGMKNSDKEVDDDQANNIDFEGMFSDTQSNEIFPIAEPPHSPALTKPWSKPMVYLHNDALKYLPKHLQRLFKKQMIPMDKEAVNLDERELSSDNNYLHTVTLPAEFHMKTTSVKFEEDNMLSRNMEKQPCSQKNQCKSLNKKSEELDELKQVSKNTSGNYIATCSVEVKDLEFQNISEDYGPSEAVLKCSKLPFERPDNLESIEVLKKPNLKSSTEENYLVGCRPNNKNPLQNSEAMERKTGMVDSSSEFKSITFESLDSCASNLKLGKPISCESMLLSNLPMVLKSYSASKVNVDTPPCYKLGEEAIAKIASCNLYTSLHGSSVSEILKNQERRDSNSNLSPLIISDDDLFANLESTDFTDQFSPHIKNEYKEMLVNQERKDDITVSSLHTFNEHTELQEFISDLSLFRDMNSTYEEQLPSSLDAPSILVNDSPQDITAEKQSLDKIDFFCTGKESDPFEELGVAPCFNESFDLIVKQIVMEDTGKHITTNASEHRNILEDISSKKDCEQAITVEDEHGNSVGVLDSSSSNTLLSVQVPDVKLDDNTHEKLMEKSSLMTFDVKTRNFDNKNYVKSRQCMSPSEDICAPSSCALSLSRDFTEDLAGINIQTELEKSFAEPSHALEYFDIVQTPNPHTITINIAQTLCTHNATVTSSRPCDVTAVTDSVCPGTGRSSPVHKLNSSICKTSFPLIDFVDKENTSSCDMNGYVTLCKTAIKDTKRVNGVLYPLYGEIDSVANGGKNLDDQTITSEEQEISLKQNKPRDANRDNISKTIENVIASHLSTCLQVGYPAMKRKSTNKMGTGSIRKRKAEKKSKAKEVTMSIKSGIHEVSVIKSDLNGPSGIEMSSIDKVIDDVVLKYATDNYYSSKTLGPTQMASHESAVKSISSVLPVTPCKNKHTKVVTEEKLSAQIKKRNLALKAAKKLNFDSEIMCVQLPEQHTLDVTEESIDVFTVDGKQSFNKAKKTDEKSISVIGVLEHLPMLSEMLKANGSLTSDRKGSVEANISRISENIPHGVFMSSVWEETEYVSPFNCEKVEIHILPKEVTTNDAADAICKKLDINIPRNSKYGLLLKRGDTCSQVNSCHNCAINCSQRLPNTGKEISHTFNENEKHSTMELKDEGLLNFSGNSNADLFITKKVKKLYVQDMTNISDLESAQCNNLNIEMSSQWLSVSSTCARTDVVPMKKGKRDVDDFHMKASMTQYSSSSKEQERNGYVKELKKKILNRDNLMTMGNGLSRSWGKNLVLNEKEGKPKKILFGKCRSSKVFEGEHGHTVSRKKETDVFDLQNRTSSYAFQKKKAQSCQGTVKQNDMKKETKLLNVKKGPMIIVSSNKEALIGPIYVVKRKDIDHQIDISKKFKKVEVSTAIRKKSPASNQGTRAKNCVAKAPKKDKENTICKTENENSINVSQENGHALANIRTTLVNNNSRNRLLKTNILEDMCNGTQCKLNIDVNGESIKKRLQMRKKLLAKVENSQKLKLMQHNSYREELRKLPESQKTREFGNKDKEFDDSSMEDFCAIGNSQLYSSKWKMGKTEEDKYTKVSGIRISLNKTKLFAKYKNVSKKLE